MLDIKEGDVVFDEDGNVCNVVGVTEVMEGRPCYKITFNDCSEIIADAEHEWKVMDNLDRQEQRRKHRDSLEQDYSAKQGKIRTTREIAASLIECKGKHFTTHSIGLAKPLQLSRAKLEIDPYVLGVWLGDGARNTGAFSKTETDSEVIHEIEKRGYCVTRSKNFTRYPFYRGMKGLKVKLKKLGILANKYIPAEYLRASYQQRLDLLRGLCDTDGYCSKEDGGCEISFSNKRLIEETLELLNSLGIKGVIRKKVGRYNGIICKDHYRMCFTTSLRVFNLSRKANLQVKKTRQTQLYRTIISCEPIESVPVKCIQVDSPSHLYLVGKQMIPTHNSYFLRWYCVRYLIRLFTKKGLRRVNAMLACEDYPSLKDRQLSKISREFPGWLGKSNADHKDYGRCFILEPEYGEGVICFRNLDDPSKYQSSEFALIAIDELTKNDYDTFTYLRTRLRWPGLKDIECPFIGATNPGGRGHNFCKQLWMDKQFPEEFIRPDDFRKQFAYVPSRATDNPHLDKSYWTMLNTLPIALRAAFRDGDWNTFVGQAFSEFSPPVHVIKPLPVPKGAPLYMTFDWGFGAPFSLQWWWVDADGRLYLFHEWYGWNGTANQGRRMTDTDIADGIIKIEAGFPMDIKNIMRIAGPDCFQKRPDYRGGGQGPSTFEVFAMKGLFLQVGDPNRALKIRQFRERLRIPVDERGNVIDLPRMLIYDTCEHFIRTIQSLSLNPNNREDVDPDSENHCFDFETEILTDEGWKFFGNLTKEEKVATLGENQIVEYQKPYKYIDRQHDGEMYSYDGRINFCVTEKHRLPIITRHNRDINRKFILTHKEVCSIKDRGWLPRTGIPRRDKNKEKYINLKPELNNNANNSNKIKLTDFLFFYGFWLAEGCLYQKGSAYLVIVDQKGDIDYILKPLGFNISKYKTKTDCIRYSICSKQFYEYMYSLNGRQKSDTKKIPRWILNLSDKYLLHVFNGMMIGDGTNNKILGVYNTVSKQLADDFQELLFKIGKVGNIKKYESKHTHILGKLIKKKNPYYRIIISEHTECMIMPNKIKKEYYHGKIYCVCVPNETIFVRRKGTPYWSLNCYDAACHAVMARAMPLKKHDDKPLTPEEKDWMAIHGETPELAYDKSGDGIEYIDETDMFG